MRKRQKYIKYDYEEVYDKSLEDMDEYFVRQMVEEGKKNIYATKEITSGEQLELEMYPEFKRGNTEIIDLEKKRAAKRKEQQDKYNDKKSQKHIERLINENFSNNDYWVTLTFDEENLPGDIKEARKKFNNYIARINYERKKRGLSGTSRYVYCIEYGTEDNLRYHIHMVIDGELGMDAVISKWCYGKKKIETMEADDNGFAGISRYITKQTTRVKRKYSTSKNLKQYKVKVNHYKFRQMDINEMIMDENKIQEKAEKTYPGYVYLGCEKKYNWFNNRFYIHVRMRKKNNEGINVHGNRDETSVQRGRKSRSYSGGGHKRKKGAKALHNGSRRYNKSKNGTVRDNKGTGKI